MPDLYAPTVEVDVAEVERDRLPDPQARLCEQLEEQPPLLGDLRQQAPELLLGQRLRVLVLLRPRPVQRQPDAGGRVRANVAGLESVGEHRLHGCEREPHRARGDAAIGDVPGEAAKQVSHRS